MFRLTGWKPGRASASAASIDTACPNSVYETGGPEPDVDWMTPDKSKIVTNRLDAFVWAELIDRES